MSALIFGGLATLTVLVIGALGLVLWMVVQGSRQRAHLSARVAPRMTATDLGDNAAAAPQGLIDRVAKSGKAIEGWVDPENESAMLMLQAGWRSAQAKVAWYSFQGAVPLVGFMLVIAYWLFGAAHPQKMLFLLGGGFAAFAFSVLIPRWVLPRCRRKASRPRQIRGAPVRAPADSAVRSRLVDAPGDCLHHQGGRRRAA